VVRSWSVDRPTRDGQASSSPVEIERSPLRRHSPVITAGAHHMRKFAVVMLLVVATMIDVCGVLLPRKLRAQGAGGTALVLSPICVGVLLPAFWSACPCCSSHVRAVLPAWSRLAVSQQSAACGLCVGGGSARGRSTGSGRPTSTRGRLS
jgi:hypothetical protein